MMKYANEVHKSNYALSKLNVFLLPLETGVRSKSSASPSAIEIDFQEKKSFPISRSAWHNRQSRELLYQRRIPKIASKIFRFPKLKIEVTHIRYLTIRIKFSSQQNGTVRISVHL